MSAPSLSELVLAIDFTKFPDDLLAEEIVDALGLPDHRIYEGVMDVCHPWRHDANGQARYRVAEIAKAAALLVEEGQAVLKALGVA